MIIPKSVDDFKTGDLFLYGVFRNKPEIFDLKLIKKEGLLSIFGIVQNIMQMSCESIIGRPQICYLPLSVQNDFGKRNILWFLQEDARMWRILK